MALEYSPIQSLDAVKPLWLFSSLYYAWTVALVALLFLGSRNSQWQGLVLVCVFALVYRGFWDAPFAAVRHPDSMVNLTLAEHIRAFGEIPFGHPNLTYVDYPGLHTLTAALATVIALPIEDATTVIMLLMDLLLAGTLFLICLKILGDARWAGLAALLGMQGSIVFSRLPFYPGTLGFVFVSLFLLLVLEQRGAMLERPSSTLLAVALLVASTITHFVSSVLLLFLIGGAWLVTYFRGGLKESFRTSTLLLYAVVPFAWLVYTAVRTFNGLTSVSAEFLNNMRQEEFLSVVFMVGGSNFGPQVPLWATALKLFWLFLLFGIGTAIPLTRLRNGLSTSSVEAKAVGALLGIALMSGAATLVSTSGSQFLRYPMYATLLVAPLLLLAVLRLPHRWREGGLCMIVASLLILSVPTFLVNYPTVRMDMFYAYEEAPAQMLGQHTNGTGVHLFAPANAHVPYVRYLPEAQYAGLPDLLLAVKNKEQLWAALDAQMDDFLHGGKGQSVYVLSARPEVYFKHNLGIPIDDPRWDAMRSRLEREAAVYDNGFVTLYEAISATGVERTQLTGR